MTSQLERIVVGLGAKGADAQELDELTRNLGDELRQIEVRSVERISKGEAPPGSKGDPFTIGWLAITLTPILANRVFDLLGEWAKRGHDRSVKVTLGENTIELSGATPKQYEKVLNKWLKQVERGKST